MTGIALCAGLAAASVWAGAGARPRPARTVLPGACAAGLAVVAPKPGAILLGVLLAFLVLAAASRGRASPDRRGAGAAALVGELADEVCAGSPTDRALTGVLGISAADAAVRAGQLRQLARRPGLAALAAVAGLLTIGDRTGAALGPALTDLAADLAATAGSRAAARAELAGVRAARTLLVALPGVALLLGTAAGLRPLPLLIGTGWGRVALTGAGALEVCGWLWLRALLRRADGPLR